MKMTTIIIIIIIIIIIYTFPEMRLAGHVARMGRGDACMGFWWGNLKEGDHLGDPGVDGRITLSWIFRKWDMVVWTGSSKLRVGTGGMHL